MHEFTELDRPDAALIERFRRYTERDLGNFVLGPYQVFTDEPASIRLVENIDTKNGPARFLTQYLLEDGIIMKDLDGWTADELAATTAKGDPELAIEIEKALLGTTDDEVAQASLLAGFIAANGLETLEELLDESTPRTISMPASALEVQELLDDLERV